MISVFSSKGRELLPVSSHQFSDKFSNYDRACLDALLQLNTMKNSSLNQLLDFILERMVKITRSKTGFLEVFDDITIPSIFASSVNPHKAENVLGEDFRTLVNAVLLNEGLESLKSPIVIQNCTTLKLAERGIAGWNGSLKNLLIVPLCDGPRTVAVAALANKDKPYKEEDIRRVTFLLDGLWKAFQNRVQKEALRTSESILHQTLNSISEPAVLLDKAFKVVMLNQAAKFYFGLKDSDSIIGKRCFEGLMKRTVACPDCCVLLRTPDDLAWTFERTGLKDSCTVERVFIDPIRDTGGRELILMRISDLSQTEHMERLSSVGLLVVSIAHNISSPASCIALNLPVLQRHLGSLFQFAETLPTNFPPMQFCGMSYAEFRNDVFSLLEDLKRGSDKINSISSALKDFVRTGEPVQQPRLKKKWVDIKQLLDETLFFCSAELAKRGLKLHMSLPEKCPPVFTDADALGQILANLLTNAAQARDKEDAWIDLKVSFRNSWQRYCIIEVRDNGCGIDESLKDKIFEPFFTTKDASSGTGLGLHICQSLIQAIGGIIEVESVKGEETCFRVALPNAERRKKLRRATFPGHQKPDGLHRR